MLKNKKDKFFRRYSLSEFINIFFSLIRSKLINRHIRLIRFPVILRGQNYIDFGHNLTTGYWCRFEVFPTNKLNYYRLILGNNIQMNDFCHISAVERVFIGDNCLFASHVYISDNAHGFYNGGLSDSSPDIAPDYRDYAIAPVFIGKNCWLGEGVIVMPGVSIGDGCVIGAHSVVKQDIPAACIAVGAPARVIKRYNFETNRWERV